MSRSTGLALLRMAAAGALVAALGLAGCGRRGGLDPPPVAAADPAVAPQPAPDGAATQDGQSAAASPRRRTPLDWLID